MKLQLFFVAEESGKSFVKSFSDFVLENLDSHSHTNLSRGERKWFPGFASVGFVLRTSELRTRHEARLVFDARGNCMGHQTIFILSSYGARTVLLGTRRAHATSGNRSRLSHGDGSQTSAYKSLSVTYIIRFYGPR